MSILFSVQVDVDKKGGEKKVGSLDMKKVNIQDDDGNLAPDSARNLVEDIGERIFFPNEYAERLCTAFRFQKILEKQQHTT